MADITDKFGKASIDTDYAQATTVKTARTPGEAVLACFDLSKLSPDTPVYFVTYKKEVDPTTNEVTIVNQTSWKALVNPDINTLTNLTLAPGYVDIGNEQGDYVECIPTSFWGNDLIEGLFKSHNPDGSLKGLPVRQALEETMKPSDLIPNSVASGGVIAQTTGLTGSFSDVVYYIEGVRYEKTGIANKQYVATRDTYVFIDTTGTVTYTDVAVNAAKPATPAGNLLVARVRTSSTEITHSTRLALSTATGMNVYTDENGWKVFDNGAYEDFSKMTNSAGVDALGSQAYLNTTNIPVGMTISEITGGTAFITYSLWSSDSRTDSPRIRHSIKLGTLSIEVGVRNDGDSAKWWGGRAHVMIRR